MRKTIKLSTAAAIIAVLVLAFTGCAGKSESPTEENKQAFDDVRDKIQSVVTDPKRAADANALVSALEQSFLDAQQNIKERNEQYRELFANYDATRADFESILDKIQADRKSNLLELNTFHRQLVDIFTPEEWDTIQKTQSKALSLAVASLKPS